MAQQKKLERTLIVLFSLGVLLSITAVLFELVCQKKEPWDTIYRQEVVTALILACQAVGLANVNTILNADYSWVPNRGALQPKDVVGDIIRALFVIQVLHSAWRLVTIIAR